MFLKWDVIAGVIRHILTVGAGYFVAIGVTDEATAMTIVAGAVAVIGVFWSIWAKQQA